MPVRGLTRSRAAVSAREVSKVYLGESGPVEALAGLSLDVGDGEFVCLAGPSGCGKSTLLRIAGGLEPPTAGAVDVAAGAEVAFVFQEHGLFPWLSVLDNAAFGLRMRGVRRRERTAIAREWLRQLGLGRFEAAYPHELSGGMRQRLSLARAFAVDPGVLLMDEPLAALDAQTRALLQEELVALWEADRKTVLLVTHSIEEAILLGDRIVVMTDRPGRVKAEFTVDLPRPRTPAEPRFGELREEIWELLRAEVRAAMEGR
jgi:NitT/TauT family transport system ATP-binding protein